MRKIYVFDTTLRDGEQSPGVTLSEQEKLAIALQLEKLGVDRIEAGFPAASPGELAGVQQVARAVKNSTIIGFARSHEKDIDLAWEAVREAEDACLHIFLATSPIHRQYKLNMDKQQVLEKAAAAIKYGKKYFSKIEFSAEDASRTELDFLCEVVDMAIRAGATIVNLPDTVGYASPIEFGNMFKTIRETVPGIEKIQLSTHCHNDLGMATANTLAAIYNGVDQIEGTINGIGERAGNTAIEEVAMALETRFDVYQAKTTLNLEEIYKTSRLVSKLTGMVVPGNKAIVGANAFAHESGIHQDGMLKERTTYEIMTPETIGLKASKLVLGKHSGRHAFKEKLIDLGYNLNEEEINITFAKFKALVDKKKHVLDDDIRILVEDQAVRLSEVYSLDYLHISYDNHSVPTATVRVQKDTGDIIEEASTGNGSVDAIYNALDKITKEEVELEDYSIKSVSRGKDALGEVYVVLRQADLSVQGRGASTDILEASALAYVDAINRLYDKQKMTTENKRGNISLA